MADEKINTPVSLSSYATAVVERPAKENQYTSAWSHKLTIMTPSSSADGDSHYNPAESVLVYGKDAILKLRDFLNEQYPVEQVKA